MKKYVIEMHYQYHFYQNLRKTQLKHEQLSFQVFFFFFLFESFFQLHNLLKNLHLQFIFIIDNLLEKAQKRKLEITTSSIFNKPISKSKKSKFHAHDSKDKIAELSAIVAVNTKLKTDPFLKDNDWNTGNNIDGNEKSSENNKDLVIIRKKEDSKQSNHHSSENTSFHDKNIEGNLSSNIFTY